MDDKKLRIAFLLLLVVAVSAVFVAMVRGFLMAILLAAIFSGLAQPVYTRILALFRGRKVLASLCTLTLALVVIVGPVVAFFGVLVSQAIHIVQTAGPWIDVKMREPDNIARLVERIPVIERLEPHREQIIMKLGEAVGAVGNFLVQNLSSATRGTVEFLFHFFLFLYMMFFFLMDGRVILNRFLSYIPLSGPDKERLADKFLSVSRATLKSTLVIGIVQGGLAGVAFAVVGISGAVFWGTLMTVLSLIPGLGTAIVWVPAVVYLIATGQAARGIALGLFCGLVVGSVDNFLRPRLVGRDVKMHPLFILLGTLGGIVLFGIAGFIVGPIVAALFVTVWDMYGAVFRETLARTQSDGGSHEPDG